MNKEKVIQQNGHQLSYSHLGNHTVSVDLDSSKRSLNKTNRLSRNKQFLMTFKNKSEQKSKSLSKTCSRLKLSRQKLKSNQKSAPKSKQKLRKKNKTAIQSSPKIKKQQKIAYDKKVRNNNKKYISRQSSIQNLQLRLPWGVDEPRLNNYVLQTLQKMQRLKKHRPQKKQKTFNTQRSQVMQQNQVKLQLTPKKFGQFENSKLKLKNESTSKEKIIKSPGLDQKTYKKSKSKLRQSDEENQTEKQIRNNHQSQSINKKKQKICQQIYRSMNGQFQCLQKNNLYQVNFRIVNKKIIQIQVAIFKKAQSLTVNLIKGSLECQSINQIYKEVMPKSSIILMSGVSGSNRKQNYIYPQLQLILNEKNGGFAFQKKILIPFSQTFLIQITPANYLKDLKMKTKIKNKSVIQQIPYRKDILHRLEKIFENNLLKFKNKQCIIYQFGFRYNDTTNLIRLIVAGAMCTLQSQSCTGANTVPIIEMFQVALGI